jgi:SAM-dependent methyltransferase
MALNLIHFLGYENRTLKSLSPDWSRIGLGISDDIALASKVPTKFFYSNTYFDTFPQLDIRNVPPEAKGKFEFVLCSDVLEHIDCDLDLAIQGVLGLLKPNGFALFSVPVVENAIETEFYPNLMSFEIINNQVHWVDKQEIMHVDNSPEFHGGRGQNLAFRQFDDDQFRKVLEFNGFSIEPTVFSSKLGVSRIERHGIYVARVRSLNRNHNLSLHCPFLMQT